MQRQALFPAPVQRTPSLGALPEQHSGVLHWVLVHGECEIPIPPSRFTQQFCFLGQSCPLPPTPMCSAAAGALLGAPCAACSSCTAVLPFGASSCHQSLCSAKPSWRRERMGGSFLPPVAVAMGKRPCSIVPTALLLPPLQATVLVLCTDVHVNALLMPLHFSQISHPQHLKSYPDGGKLLSVPILPYPSLPSLLIARNAVGGKQVRCLCKE